MKEPTVIHRGTQTPEEAVFGYDAPIHPITKMRLERGHGALPDDLQAQNVHLPTIWQTQGQAVHDLIAADLKKYRQEKYDRELAEAKAKFGKQ